MRVLGFLRRHWRAAVIGAGVYLLAQIAQHLYWDHRAHHIIDQQVAAWMQQAAEQQKATPGGGS